MKNTLVMLLMVLALIAGCVTTVEESTTTTEESTTTITTTTATITTTTAAESTTTTTASTSTTTASTTSTTKSTETITEEPTTVDVSISTDRGLYHSNEMMEITVEVQSEKSIEGAAVRVYGLMRGSRLFLDKKQTIDIEAGSNEYLFEKKTPSCNTCAGLRPGLYDITAEITYLGEIIGEDTTQVEIKQ